MFINTTVITDTDSYKASHWVQYPEGTTRNYAYYEARGGDYKNTMFFGLQPLLHELALPITKQNIDDAEKLFLAHGVPFNRAGWEHILQKHGGFLPLKIKAVPEGSVIPTSNVLMTVENTDPEVAWLTSYVETKLSRIWYPCTVATRSWHCHKIIMEYLMKTSEDPENEILYKLHDFGSRGASSLQTAAIGGAAHLIPFRGTDTVAAIPFLQHYYKADMPGHSIPASEHSTMTTHGREHEVEAYRNMIKQYGDRPIFACVSDSYNIFEAAEKLWGGVLKQEVEDMNAILVIRPDSGDPVKVVAKLIQILDSKFGSQLNSKGYKVLKKVRIIQGDGMNQDQIRNVYEAIYKLGFSADNLAVGMGAGLLQKLDRDTCKFAYKTSYMEIDGLSRDIYKEPATDKGKVSKKGLLSLRNWMGKYETVNGYEAYGDLLETVFENGKILREYTLDEVRQNAMYQPATI